MGLKQTGVNFCGLMTAVSLPAVCIAYGWRVGFALLGIVAIVLGILPFILYRNPPNDGAEAGSAASEETICDCVTPAEKKESSLTVFKSWDIWMLGIVAAALTANEFSVFNFYVLYLKEHALLPVVTAGFLLGAIDAGGLCAKPITGVISDRLFKGRRKETFIILAATTTLFTVIIALLPVGTPLWAILICSLIYGFAAGGWVGIFFTMAGEFAGKEHCGVVTGFANTFCAVAVTVGVPMFGYLADKTHNWTWSWVYAVALAAMATFLLFFVHEERKKLHA
jgi:sugar phosphate permease